MANFHWITLQFLATCFSGISGVYSDNSYYGRSDESILYHRMFNNSARDRFTRPIKDSRDAVRVEVSLALIGLDGLDPHKQVLTSHVWLRQRWNNPFLRWDPVEFGGSNVLLVPVDQIWVPDLVPHNSLADSYYLHHDSLAKVSHTGEVVWITQARLETFCAMYLTDFPYDEHTCSIKFRSWAYDKTLVNLSHWGEAQFDLDFGSPREHQTWDIVNTTAEIRTQMYRCCLEPYQDLTAHVTLRRRPTYVTHVFVAPAVIFVLLVPAVFMLPADSPHKFILGTGILMSQVLLLIMLEEFLQSAFATIPRIGLYYLSILVLVSFSLGISSFVANLWNRSRRRSVGVPGVIRVVLLKGLGRLICVQYDDFLTAEPVTEMETDTISTNMDSVSNASMNPLDGAKMIREYNSHVVNRAEWRQLAAIVDRLFCLVFLVVSALIATAILIKF